MYGTHQALSCLKYSSNSFGVFKELSTRGKLIKQIIEGISSIIYIVFLFFLTIFA